MKKLISAIFILTLSTLCIANTESALKKAYQGNMTYLQKENVNKAMSFIHSKSPVFPNTKALVHELVKAYDLTYKVLSFKYIGGDKEYQVARVIQETKKVTGPAFRNNITDTLQVFKKEGRQWKIWQSTILKTEFLDENRSVTKTKSKGY